MAWRSRWAGLDPAGCVAVGRPGPSWGEACTSARGCRAREPQTGLDAAPLLWRPRPGRASPVPAGAASHQVTSPRLRAHILQCHPSGLVTSTDTSHSQGQALQPRVPPGPLPGDQLQDPDQSQSPPPTLEALSMPETPGGGTEPALT